MKDFRSSLIRSLSLALLATLASSPLGAATFSLADESELTYVSSLAVGRPSQKAIRAAYAIQQPRFLPPLFAPDATFEEDRKAQSINIWMAAGPRIRFDTLPTANGLADESEPRLRWKAQDPPVLDYALSEPSKYHEADQPPIIEASDNREHNEILYPFVVHEQDTTCGFPVDILERSTSTSQMLRERWVKTAFFEPHPYNGPRIPRSDGISWMEMPMGTVSFELPERIVDGVRITDALLRYSVLDPHHSNENQMMTISGFYQKPNVFRCREYASYRTNRITPMGFGTAPNLFKRGTVGPWNDFVVPVAAAVPLPGSGGLLAAGLAALFLRRKAKTSA